MRNLTITTAFLLMFAVGASAQQDKAKEIEKGAMKEMKAVVTRAICSLMPLENGSVTGTVTFEAVDGGVKVVAEVTGLTPGKHGFHIHEFGDCSALDYKSAGGHLMAMGEEHAGPDNKNRHIGDMGNLVADAEGKAHLELIDGKLSFFGPHSILGRAIIVHAQEDDLTTQPTGNAGGRVACGTIGIAKP